MAEREGVVRYDVRHEQGPLPPIDGLSALDAWRTVLHRLGLVGQTPERYAGYGYGNVSRRTPAGFVISGTQTGGPEQLGPDGYVLVTAAVPEGNRVVSRGPVRPSSEALSHAACYAADPGIDCVLHVHAPELWRCASDLDVPITDPRIAYGTPEMAAAVGAALAAGNGARLVVMGGHEDGILAVGANPDEAGRCLVSALARALAI